MSDPNNPYQPAPAPTPPPPPPPPPPPAAPSGAGGYGAYGPYGTAMPPAPYGEMLPVATPPGPVKAAVVIMLINAVLGLIGVALLYAGKSTIRNTLASRHPEYDQQKLDSLVNTTITASVVVAIVFIVLYVLLALQVRKGKNWARIVTWILAGLGVLSAVASLTRTASAGSHVSGLVGGLLDLVLIILLANKESSQFFLRRTY